MKMVVTQQLNFEFTSSGRRVRLEVEDLDDDSVAGELSLAELKQLRDALDEAIRGLE